AHLEGAKLVDDEWIGRRDLTRFVEACSAQDGQSVAKGVSGGDRKRAGNKQRALFLEADHVFEMLGQESPDLLGRRGSFGEDHVKRLTQHSLGELLNSVLGRHCHDATYPDTAHGPRPVSQSLCGLSAMGNRPWTQAIWSTHSLRADRAVVCC